jgi:serpin B
VRKAILSVIVAAILISVSVVSVNWLYHRSDGPSSGPPPTTVSGLVECSNEFSFDMYAELAASGDENVFFSPYSITTALGIAYEGARGQTASEMAQVLNFPADNSTRWDMMKSYQDYFSRVSDSYNLSTANAYWLKENQDLKEIYRNAIESYYLAHGEELDFAGDPSGSAETINAWVEEQTNGKIRDLISPSMIVPATYLILTNAIYFKSDWKYQFNDTATENSAFHLEGGIDTDTQMMHMHDAEISLNYSENDDVQLLQLPYKDGALSMYILLPKDYDIGALESKLDNEYLGSMMEDLSPEEVNLYMPKFKFEQKYTLNQMLIDMGMPTAFSDCADFSGMTDSTSLKIGFVIHQSYVDVNEEGTEAAAATAVGMEATGINPHPQPQPILFNADHPFIFFIQHEETGQILFMGKVGNPSA